MIETTLIVFKPSSIARGLVGSILSRFEAKGLTIVGMKMMQLDESLLREHYAHLIDRPFFPSVISSMTATPVIVLALRGRDAIATVRMMTGATNGREAAAGTIRGDYSMSNQENVIHASSSPEDAAAELKRFFAPGEIIEWTPDNLKCLYAASELQ